MTSYTATVTRDGRWWMITIDALAGHRSADGAVNLSTTTQARRLADVPAEARDFICTVTDSAPSDVDVQFTVNVEGFDATGAAEDVRRHRQLATEHAEAAKRNAQALARQLAAHGVAVRDIGELLDLSYQRAQQLITT